jgi:hypothetical protein
VIDVYRTTPADLRRLALGKGGRQGYVAASDGTTAGQLHYTKAGELKGRWNNDVPRETRKVEDRLIRKLHEGLPPQRRRTDEQRYRSMFNRLAQVALESYRRVGYAAWPKSIETDLKVLGWTTGDPKLEAYGGERKVLKQVEELTRLYIERGSNSQKVKDQRKPTLDWHGHYST